MRFETQFLFPILISIYPIPDCQQSETDVSLSPFSRRWIYYKGQVEIHENWIEATRYLNMDLLEEHKRELLRVPALNVA